MSMNHFSSSDIPEAIWWTKHHSMEPNLETQSSKYPGPCLLSLPTTIWATNSQLYDHHHGGATSTPSMVSGKNSAFSFNLNQEDDEELVVDEQLPDGRREGNPTMGQFQERFGVEIKEPMFEKPLTPSDVGKLNRLVIPKQHAEKYFPLGGGDAVEKGLLLSFEDESGKCWRFRYSYWNSSQSYVLTKGWSRYVKEKRLDAGDVVMFERHRLDGDRLFIGWRRRSYTPATAAQDGGAAQPAAVVVANCSGGGGGDGGGGGGGGRLTRVFYSAHSYPLHPLGPPTSYQPDCFHAGTIVHNQTTPSGNSKRLRLFGVNMECQLADESEPSTPDGSSTSSQGQAHFHYPANVHVPSAHTETDINFSRAVNRTRYDHGE